MTKLRNVTFLLMLLVALSVHVLRADESVNVFEDFLDFYSCDITVDGNEYFIMCDETCDENPYFTWDAEGACEYWCAGEEFVNHNLVGNCFAACSCRIPE